MSIDLGDVQECGECGALFVDYEMHAGWHRRQDERLGRIARNAQRAAASTMRFA